MAKVVRHHPHRRLLLLPVRRDMKHLCRNKGRYAAIKGVQLRLCLLSHKNVRNLLHRYVDFGHQRGVVGHDIHQPLPGGNHAAGGVHLQPHDASRYRSRNHKPPLGILKRAQLLAYLQDLAVQIVDFPGGLLDDADGHALLLQK